MTMVRAHAGPDTDVYLCGPEPMTAMVRGVLDELGVPDSAVHVERFTAPADPATPVAPDVAATATLAVSRPHAPAVSVPVPPGATLLEALEAAAVPAAYSCRVGDCGTCHARLLRGEVAMSSVEGLLPEDEQAGHVLLCVARPVSGALHVELPT